MQSFSFVEKNLVFRVLTFPFFLFFFFKDKIYCYIFFCVSQLAAKKNWEEKGRKKNLVLIQFFLKQFLSVLSVIVVALIATAVSFLWEVSSFYRGRTVSQNLVHLLLQQGETKINRSNSTLLIVPLSPLLISGQPAVLWTNQKCNNHFIACFFAVARKTSL